MNTKRCSRHFELRWNQCWARLLGNVSRRCCLIARAFSCGQLAWSRFSSLVRYSGSILVSKTRSSSVHDHSMFSWVSSTAASRLIKFQFSSVSGTYRYTFSTPTYAWSLIQVWQMNKKCCTIILVDGWYYVSAYWHAKDSSAKALRLLEVWRCSDSRCLLLCAEKSPEVYGPSKEFCSSCFLALVQLLAAWDSYHLKQTLLNNKQAMLSFVRSLLLPIFTNFAR